MPFDAKSGMAKEWPDRRILYPRAEKHGLSGRIFAKCTLRQRLFSLKRTKCVYLAKIGCPRVHFSEILPESRLPAAQEYKMFFSCHADGRIGASLPQIGQLALPSPPPPIGKGRFAHPKEPTPPYAFIITPHRLDTDSGLRRAHDRSIAPSNRIPDQACGGPPHARGATRP